ncbi:MAG: hypothetical protein LLG00_01610 [Planctomycetaceae bacterium]|nr:hypothetical protein [Planctomycetaceae bacterium]
MELCAILLFLAVVLLACVGLSAAKGELRRSAMRQTGIRDVLVYVALWAICLAPIHASLNRREHFIAEKDWPIFATWFILAAFYVWSRCFSSLLMHSLGVLFNGVIILANHVPTRFTNWNLDESLRTGWAMSVGMYIGSFGGLMFFSVLKLIAFCRPGPPQHKSEP